MPKLALSMIVRDAAEALRACLESARDAVDEMVIADTGSADETAAIALGFGAKVIHIPWQDDFAAARNLALAEVTADWVLSLDADELLDPEGTGGIRKLLERGPAGGYQVTIRNYVLRLEDRIWDRPARPNDSRLPAAQPFPAYVEHENVRLFRRDPRIRFVGRVHESVGPSIERAGLRLERAPLLIHHFGLASSAETRARKNIFYRDLGKRKILEMPESFQAHLELGVVELDNFANTRQAVEHFDRAAALNPKFGVAWFFAGLGRVKLGENREAIECLSNAVKQGHRTSFVFETAGDAHYNLGEYSDAALAYEQGIQIAGDSAPLESKLGLATVRLGQMEKGLKRIREAMNREPAHPEIHDRLILSLAWLGREKDAASAAEEKLRSVRTPLPSDFLRAATLWAGLGEWARAGAMLHVGSVVYPQNLVLKQALSNMSAEEIHGGKNLFERLTEEARKGVGIGNRG